MNKKIIALLLLIVCLVGIVGTAMAATITLHPGQTIVVRTYPDGTKMVVSYAANSTAYANGNTYINGYLHFI